MILMIPVGIFTSIVWFALAWGRVNFPTDLFLSISLGLVGVMYLKGLNGVKWFNNIKNNK